MFIQVLICLHDLQNPDNYNTVNTRCKTKGMWSDVHIQITYPGTDEVYTRWTFMSKLQLIEKHDFCVKKSTKFLHPVQLYHITP